MLDESGHLLSDPPLLVIARWYRHFTKVLNVASDFSVAGIDRMPQLEVRENIPSFDEYQRILGKLRLKKSGGKSGVLRCWCILALLSTELFQRV